MSINAILGSDRLSYRHRSQPVRAVFVPRRRDRHFCPRCGRAIASDWPTADRLSDGIACMPGFTATSCQRRAIQIPIALRHVLTAAQHPAVSSLEASPTPTR